MAAAAVDIEAFYEADERRRRSEEVELGDDWHDADGIRYEVAWIADTGELYVMREPAAYMSEDPFGDLYTSSVPEKSVTAAVVGWIPELEQVEQVLVGWEQAMTRENSVAWLAERLRERSVPREAPTA